MKQVNNICPDVQHVGEYPKGASYYPDGTNDLVVGKQIFICRRQKEDSNLFPQVFILREQMTFLKEKVILTEQVINLF